MNLRRLLPGRSTCAAAVLLAGLAGIDRPTTAEPLNLNAKNRCAIAKVVAKQMVWSRDFERRLPGERRDKMALLVSLKTERYGRGQEVSLLRSREPCGEANIGHAYGLPGDVRVTLGRGRRQELPPGTLFAVARLRSVGQSRWEVSWTEEDSIMYCPKERVCLGPAKVLVPWPTWRATIVESNGTFDVESTVLEFIKRQRHEPDAHAGTVLGDLPLDDRCEVVEKLAGEIVKVVDYSEWYGLLTETMVMRFANSEDKVNPSTADSPFGQDDRCEGIKVHHFYASGASVAAKLDADVDASKRMPRFGVKTKVLSRGRWELSWAMDSGLWTCPKPDDDHYVGGCLAPSSARITPPSLHVVFVKTTDAGVALETSWLGFDALPHAESLP